MVMNTELSRILADRNSPEFLRLFSACVDDGWSPEQLKYLIERPGKYTDEYRRYRAAELLEAPYLNTEGDVLLSDCNPEDELYDWCSENIYLKAMQSFGANVAVDYSGDDWEPPKRKLARGMDDLEVALILVRRADEDGRTIVLYEIEATP